MLKIMILFGTRPEAIKLLPVVKEFQKFRDKFQLIIGVTSQHKEMLQQVLKLFSIRPDFDLGIMRNAQSLNYISSTVLSRMEDILKSVAPDWVLLQGDTTTAMAASLAGFHCGIRIGHVEAGLRTHNKLKPYPEEVNRIVVDVVSDLHFAPTQEAKQNLKSEGHHEASIFVTGNTVIDALQMILKLNSPTALKLSSLGSKKLILVTMHRRESFGTPMKKICLAIKEISRRYEDTCHIVYPVHLNPNVQATVRRILGDNRNITLLDPLDYFSFVHLMNESYLILTDSGGVQEEASALGKPLLVLRDVTERPEGVKAGVAKIVGTDKNQIIEQTSLLIDNEAEYLRMARAVSPYGDGNAAKRIVDIMSRYT